MRTRRLAVVVATLVALLSVSGAGDPRALRADSDDEQLRRQVAQERGIPLERLEVVSRVAAGYPETGAKLDLAKVRDTQTGEIHSAALDANGKAADPAAAAAAEEKARDAKHGKLDAGLTAKVDRAGGNDRIPVAIWVAMPEPPLNRPDNPDAADPAALGAMLAAVEQHVSAPRQQVASLVARGGGQARVPRYAPVVFAELTPGQIRSLAREPSVAAIYGQAEYARHEDDATSTERTPRVWQNGNLGGPGTVRPVVHEDDGISDGNPFLNNGTHAVTFWCSDVDSAGRCPSGKLNTGANDHASLVAGVVASTHPLVRGVAPNVQQLLSANFQDFNNNSKIVDANEWARANGGDPTNMSWGTLCFSDQTFSSRYVDWATRALGQTFVISAGNNPGCGVSSPGIAFSVITVGSQFDNNDGGWAGDGISAFSAATEGCVASGNCTSDFEKPEVVAVGQDIRSTNNTGGVNAGGVNGTSFSAPQVTGQVAAMLFRKPGQNTWPETNKAAVLASGYHDIVAGSREQDGVGSVVMNNSDDTYRLNRFLNSSASCASFSGCVGPFNRLHDNLISIPSTALNKPVRVAIAWDADSNGSTTDRQGADIDLCVRNPANVIIACSSSFGNTWELVEFTPTVAGAYDVSLTLFDCPGYPGGSVAERCSAGASSPSWPGTFYGVAWSFRDIPDICTAGGSGGLFVLPATGGTRSVNTANGWTFFDSYPTSAFNQSGREGVLQVTTTATQDLRATDTNASLDLHWVRITNCAAPTVTALASGINTAQVNDAPAGTYQLIVDGFNGAVGTTSVTVSVLPTATFGAEAAQLGAEEQAEPVRR